MLSCGTLVVKYENVNIQIPYNAHVVASRAWIVRLPDGRRLMYLCSSDVTIEHVHSLIKLEHPVFKLGCMDVGTFEIKAEWRSLRGDAREVDQDWNVSVEGI